MSNQSEDGWYPECEMCGCGNLGKVVCWDCYDKEVKHWMECNRKARNELTEIKESIDVPKLS